MAHEKMYAVCDSKCLVQINQLLTVTVPASGWSSSAPYTQTVTLAGMSQHFNATYAPDIKESTTADQEKQIKKACGFISMFETLDGKIKLTCKAKKPTVDIPLMVKVV